jgi:hypothetical protein
MVVVPAATPVIRPPLLIVAAPVVLLHVPLGVASDTTAVAPTQIAIGVAGSIGAGLGLTPIVVDTVQVPTAYVIGAPPTLTPLTTPVVSPTVATGVNPLVHVPPGTELLRTIVDPWQTVEGPVIGPGVVVTVSTATAGQLPTI